MSDTRNPAPTALDPTAVSARAYAIWVRGGRRPARALDDWLQAERELRDELAKAKPAACCGPATPVLAPAPVAPPPTAPAPVPPPPPVAATKPLPKQDAGQRPAKKVRGGKRR